MGFYRFCLIALFFGLFFKVVSENAFFPAPEIMDIFSIEQRRYIHSKRLNVSEETNKAKAPDKDWIPALVLAHFLKKIRN